MHPIRKSYIYTLDTYFMVGTGSKPSPYGTKVPDETGSLAPLKKYRRESVQLSLPANIDVRYRWWCRVTQKHFPINSYNWSRE